MKPSHEDNRIAVQIALNAAQAFFQITIGLSALLIGYYQFALKDVPGTQPVAFVFIIVSGLTAIISLGAGFHTMSKAYKRVDGREPVANGEDIWSTKALASSLGLQSTAGLCALGFSLPPFYFPLRRRSKMNKKKKT